VDRGGPGALSASLDATAEALERSRDALRRCRVIVEKLLGGSPGEVRETLRAVEGLTPAQIREALMIFRGLRMRESALEAVS